MKTSTRFSILTNKQLHRAVVSLARRERECTLSMVDHLIEVERRRLYAELGHSSIYGYCTDELAYSKTAANRRIVAARTVRRFPRIRRLLVERRLTLSTLAAIGPDLDGENCRALLSRLCGKSAEDAQRALAEMRGIRPIREKIQRVVTIARDNTRRSSGGSAPGGEAVHEASANLLSAPSTQPIGPIEDMKIEVRCGPVKAQPADSTPVTLPKATEHRFRFEFSGDEAFMALYQQAAALVSNRLRGRVSIEDTMKLALEALIDRDDPGRRAARRESRASHARSKEAPPVPNRRMARAAGQSADERTSTGKNDVDKSRVKRSRHIPMAVRDAIHRRDGSRCTFVSDQGRRCHAVRNLQIDHILPWAKGGNHELKNLRLLCATHNRLSAEREFGPVPSALKCE